MRGYLVSMREFTPTPSLASSNTPLTNDLTISTFTKFLFAPPPLPSQMRCTFVSRTVDADGEFRYQVELSSNGRNIAQEVLTAGYGRPDQPVSARIPAPFVPAAAAAAAGNSQ